LASSWLELVLTVLSVVFGGQKERFHSVFFLVFSTLGASSQAVVVSGEIHFCNHL
jgi:hypothetical protein